MTERRMGSSVRARVRVMDDDGDVVRRDSLATEEPLEIRLAAGTDRRVGAVTMRTPGHDFDLVAGWLLAEGIVTAADELLRVDYCTDVDVAQHQQYNVVTATLAADTLPDLSSLERHSYTSSACGVCGKASIDALAMRSKPVRSDATLSAEVLYGLPEQLRAAQGVFTRTGGLHAAGLFDLDGTPIGVREDVGRHNAVDKVIGAALLSHRRQPGRSPVLVVSGRTSFEIVQKAVAADIAFLVAVSAPSSLAVSLAQEFGVTLAGFVRERRANVYANADRIVRP